MDKKQTESSINSKRLRLKLEEVEVINEFRRVKTELKNRGINPKDVPSLWIKDKELSVLVKNPDFGNKIKSYDEIRDDLVKQMNAYSPKYSKIAYSNKKNPHLLIIDPADIHIGKLATVLQTGSEYNVDIAVDRVFKGVQGILEKVKGFDIEQIVFVIGNDCLHTDKPNATTAGTPQDCDGMWYENFLTAKDMYVTVIETLMQIAPIHIMFNPSNHDYQSGFLLADSIGSWFRKSKNITFDISINHRKYFRYHNSLIGTTHGDGAKTQHLPLIMANEQAENWSNTKFRYYYTHHIHHKQSKDFIGCTVESLRSPSSSDAWHHKKGYLSKPAIEGFLHSRECGQIARITNYF